MEVFSSFACGDVQLQYFRSGNTFELCLVPVSMIERVRLDETIPKGMIQFKLSGTPFGHEAQYTLRNSPCTEGLRFLSQKKHANKVLTRFQYGNGLLFDHVVELHDGWVRVWLELENQSGTTIGFDLLSSFSLGMISPFENGKCYLERVTERWHHEELSMERAGMERPNSLRFGTNGTMPVTQYYPFAGIEDRTHGVLWGVQLENNGAWMLEFASSGREMCISGGIPDIACCGQPLSVLNGGKLTTPSAVLTCVKGDILTLFNRLQISQRTVTTDVSPVYNGPFSTETLELLKDFGIKYYVLDHELTPDTSKQILSAGLIPGITLDIETIPRFKHNSPIVTQNGLPIQFENRVLADYRDLRQRNSAVQKLCKELKEKKIGYVKFDCPAVFCGGCDGNGTPMENQQQYTDCIFDFYAKVKQRMPELVMEFSTNGIGRFSAKWLTLADLVTSLDELPTDAESMAALDRQMLAPSCKCGVRVSLSSGEDIYEKLNASLQGRLVLSGNLGHLREAEKDFLKEFLTLSQTALPVLRDGTYQLGHIIDDSCIAPSGWQMFRKSLPRMQLMVVISFSPISERLSFDMPREMRLISEFSKGITHSRHGEKLELEITETRGTAAFLFAK